MSVEKKSKDQLKAMSTPALIKYAKALQADGYDINPKKKLMEFLEADMDDQDEQKPQWVKIIHKVLKAHNAGDSEESEPAPSKAKAEAKASPRHAELKEMSNKQLRALAKEKRVPGYTSMAKSADYIAGILAVESGSVEPSKKKRTPNKTQFGKKSARDSEDDTERSEVGDIQVEADADMDDLGADFEELAVAAGSDTEDLADDLVEDMERLSVKAPSKKASKGSKSSPKKMCGDFDYEELLEKRLTELHALLNKKGVDASGVHDKEKAVDLYCQLSNGSPTCSDKKGCPGDLICDVTSKPGVCVDSSVAAKGNMEWLEHNGKQFIGSAKAIEAMRAKLGVEPYKFPAKKMLQAEGFQRERLIQKAVYATGRSKSSLQGMTNRQIEMLLEGHIINENKSLHRLARDIYNEPPEEDYSLYEDVGRKKLLKKFTHLNKDRASLIESLASWFKRPPSDFSLLPTQVLEERWRAAQENEEGPMVGEKRRLIKSIIAINGQHAAFYNDWTLSELRSRLSVLQDEYPRAVDLEDVVEDVAETGMIEDEEDKKLEVESEEEEEPAEEKIERRRQETIKPSDVTNTLAELSRGGHADIAGLTKVQQSVLKCLGLVSA